MMTGNDIITMAREAGFVESNAHSDIIVRHSNGSWVAVHDLLENFAALVAAAEREACVKALNDQRLLLAEDKAKLGGLGIAMCVDAIKTRGKK